MQPFKLIIPGDYWDSWLYKGKLYIWDMDGAVGVYDWDRMLGEVSESLTDRLPSQLAFCRGDIPYSEAWTMLSEDSSLHAMLKAKFEQAPKEIEITNHLLRSNLIAEQNNPFGGLPVDVEFYAGSLYAISDVGVSRANADGSTKFPISSRPQKVWEGRPYSIRAQGRRLAMAGGDEGLFEARLSDDLEVYEEFDFEDLVESYAPDETPKKVDDHIYLVSKKPSSIANWAFSSIYSTSLLTDGYLAGFKTSRADGARFLEYAGIYEEGRIFGRSGLTVGAQDKLYSIYQGNIQAVKFDQRHLKEQDAVEKSFKKVGEQSFEEQGEIYGLGVALFGVVIEHQNSLTVIQSNGEQLTIWKRPTRWRVFPRSKRYEDQLHVITYDALEVYGFWHDFFVNQERKSIGIAARPSRRRYGV